MDLTLYIPDEIALRLGQTEFELSRLALEALAVEEYKRGHINKAELRHLLRFTDRGGLDGFLKEHGVYEGFSIEEIEEQVEGLRQLGF